MNREEKKTTIISALVGLVAGVMGVLMIKLVFGSNPVMENRALIGGVIAMSVMYLTKGT